MACEIIQVAGIVGAGASESAERRHYPPLLFGLHNYSILVISTAISQMRGVKPKDELHESDDDRHWLSQQAPRQRIPLVPSL